MQSNTKFVWLETPTNPLLKVVDIAAASGVAHRVGAKLVVDNTFMSSYFQQPLSLGADIVVHSSTKYLGGHSDVVGGAVLLDDDELAARLRFLENAMGTVPGPLDCWLVLRGVKTLAVRMRAHDANANHIARWLERHPRVQHVCYPGLESHPDHRVAKRQQTGFGGMLSFVIEGGLDSARHALERLKVFTLAESLGGVESLAEHPATMTHSSLPIARRESLGVGDGLVRLSVGIEDIDDLVDDLEHALEV
jgi:cystathionine gamma-lyase